jgi:hypothetical protein
VINKYTDLQSQPPAESQDASVRFLGELGHSLAYSTLQYPLNGVSQVFDQTLGRAVGSHLYDKTRDAIVAAPVPADFGSAGWYGQTIGGALGVVPWFMMTRSGLRSAAGAIEATQGLVVTASEAALNKSVLSSTGLKMALEGGATGAVYAGLFKPVQADNGNYWSDKSRQVFKDFTVFSTLTASSVFLGSKLPPLALPLVHNYPAVERLLPIASTLLAGASGGLPAATVDMALDYGLSGGRVKLSPKDFAKNVIQDSLIGSFLSAAPTSKTLSRSSAESKFGAPIIPAIKSVSDLDAVPGLEWASTSSTIRSPQSTGLSDLFAPVFRNTSTRDIKSPTTQFLSLGEGYIDADWITAHARTLQHLGHNMPFSYHRLSGPDLVDIGKARPHMQPQLWQEIPVSDAADVARAASASYLNAAWQGKPENLIEFGKWYGKNSAEIGAAPPYYLRNVLNQWDNLGSTEKNDMPPLRLIERATELQKESNRT